MTKTISRLSIYIISIYVSIYIISIYVWETARRVKSAYMNIVMFLKREII